MKKSKAMKVFLLVAAVILTIMVSITATAAGLFEYNGSMYSLSLKSEKDFSDGKYTAVDNGIGTVSLDTIDSAHGNSVALGAGNGVDISKEGAWMQMDGDKSQRLAVYEFELYVDKMSSGNLRFFQKGINSSSEPAMYLTSISSAGITNGTETKPFSFNTWHKIRFVYDCVGHSYGVYVDDMSKALLSGSFNEKFDAVQYMRVTLWAADAYVAVDNVKYYSMQKMIDNYERPRFSIVQSEERLTESEAVHLEAKIETKAEIENVKFYIDNKLEYTDTTSPFVLEKLFEKGSYNIRAVATDIYGETGEDVKNITVNADTKPRVVLGLNDGAEYDKEELRNISVSVTMSEAELVSGNILADGAVIAKLNAGYNTVDLSSLSVGKHVVSVYAENNLEEHTEAAVNITVKKSFDDIVWSMNFNDGSKLGTLNGSGQFTRLQTLRDDFRDSLLVGANTTQDISKEGAWIPFEFKNITTTAVADFDLYFNDINGNGMTVMLVLSSKRPTLFKITPSGIVDANNQVVGTFEKERWYHVTLTVDSANALCSLKMDDNEIFKNQPISGMERGAAMPSIRLVSMLQGTNETYYAVDNIYVRQITQAPSIVNITSEKGGENSVSAHDKEIKVYFSGALQTTSVYPSKFSIDGAVIEKAVYNADNYCVTLTLSKPLSAGTYRLNVAENLVMGNGEIYGEKLFGEFDVKSSLIEALSTSVSGGFVSAEIMNNSNESKNVYMIVNLYNGDEMKTSTVKEITLRSGQNQIFEPVLGYTSGDKTEVFMWDSLVSPACFASFVN